MKKTYFLAMITAALMGGQVRAEYTGTAIEGHDPTAGDISNYYGKYSVSGSATAGNVTIKADEYGEVPNNADVYGGSATNGNASTNYVTISGGEVRKIFGGHAAVSAEGNIVTMTGGKSGSIFGGRATYGNATENGVAISAGYVEYYVRGGYTYSGNATGNTVTMSGGEIAAFLHGGYTDSGEASGNTVTMDGGEVGDDVYGGYSRSGEASGNTVTMSGGIVTDYVYSGYTANGNANGNTIEMTGGVAGGLQGGTASVGNANDNVVIFSGGTLEEIDGGVSFDQGEASGNRVVMSGGTVTYRVYSGSAVNGNATGNAVTMSDGEVGDNVYGGYVDDTSAATGNATGNAVTIAGGQVGDKVYGGYTPSGDATGNTVNMTGGKVGDDVYGGYTHSGDATKNAVTINDGYVNYSVHGGYVDISGAATGNTVTIAGGYVDVDVLGGYTYSGAATGNTVTMTGGEVGRDVYGGCVVDSGAATDNTVTMTGGEVRGEVYGGFTSSGDATGNIVNITGGKVNEYVYGGYTNSGDATGNTVTINDGYVDRRVYGGFTKSGKANGNIVNMAGGKCGRHLYGGYVDGDGNATGNTVNMSGGEVEGTVVGGVAVGGDATANTVNMTGGTASMVVGGGAGENGNVSGNTVNMAGGSATEIYGGFSETEDGYAKENFVLITGGKADFVCGGAAGGAATGNTVTMTGGEVGDDVYGGYTYFGEASGNTVHLVGEGASYTVGDTTYKGGNIAIQGSVHGVYVEAGGVSSNNSVHIHGTGASIGGTIDSCQRLNFHIVQGQAGAQGTPMVTLGGALNLEGVELGFYGDAVTDWAAFEGKSVTLVGMTNETITGLVTQTDPVDITDEGGKTVATATLTLSDDKTMLSLTNIQGITPVPPPVPTAGPDALDVTLVNSLWASSAYVREFVRLAESQGYALKAGDTAVWGGGFGTFMHATGDRGFKSDGGGYGIGVNHAFSANTQAGISLGQGFGSYHNSGKDGAHVHQRAILAAATASTRIGKDLSLGAHLAFGSVRNRADCRLDGATERARWNDTVFNLGAQAAYDFHVTERTAITPFLGLDWMNGAHESFTGGYARHYSHGRLNELRMPVGVTVSTSTEVGTTKLLPQLSVAYVPSLAQQVPHANVSDNGANYRVKGYAPGRNAFMLNVGVNAVFSDSWSAGAFYTLETRSHSVDQSVNASVRYTF